MRQTSRREIGDQLSDCGAKLEAVPGASEGDDHVFVIGMHVDDEMVIEALLIEAGLVTNARAHTAGEEVIEQVGDFPSPSVLVNGVDVTGADPHGPAACVLAPPSAAQIQTGKTRGAVPPFPDEPGVGSGSVGGPGLVL